MMSLTMLSQNTKDSLKISRPAFALIVKDLQKCDNLKEAYIIQSNDLINLTDSTTSQLKDIEKLQVKNEFWQQQVDLQQEEITKLQKKKSNSLTWLTSGAVGGLILGILIAK